MMERVAAPALSRLKEPGPDFQAVSIQGKVSLSQFKGKWVALFSHPAHFTPACATEFVRFARNHEAF